MVRSRLRWAGITIAGIVAIAALLLVNAFYFKPFSIRVLFETAFLKIALRDPELLSSMRLLEQFGLTFHNDDLTDVSPAHTEAMNALLTDTFALLKEYDRAALEGQTALSYDILYWFLENQVDGIRFTWHGYPVNQMSGVQNEIPRFMASIHFIGSTGDAEDYVTRLSKVGIKFDQLLEDLRLRESKGIIPPRFTIEKVLAEMQGFRETAPGDNIMFTSFSERLGRLEGLDAGARGRLEQAARAEIAETVYPAYDHLIAYFEQLRSKAREDNGVWNLPDGDAYYDYMLRQNTTTRLSADQIHELGQGEVARILAEMDAILRGEGYAEGSVAERMIALGKEDRFLYANTAEGRGEMLDAYRAIITEILAGMPQHFGRLPKATVEVKRVPEFAERGAPGAYYEAPSMDGARPGVFYANLRDVRELPKFGMRTLSYHEAVPGHHLQRSLQGELTGVPTFRRILGFTAFAEGWALYAERLAWEAGYEKDAYDNLGRLQDEMLRAVRLVVDTGIHRKHWTRDQAIDYMYSNTGQAYEGVVTEIERYFVMPGQATAYKVGMLKILELRDRARQALGDRFDIRDFHDVVIGNGDLPLDVLEQQVNRWIEERTTG
ncbi:MAG: DUF885 domain-containing protein [Gammaproteobacteria bacterium]|nr:DUF885 domain-containing protein [Gammaproteobacteria bacterium]